METDAQQKANGADTLELPQDVCDPEILDHVLQYLYTSDYKIEKTPPKTPLVSSMLPRVHFRWRRNNPHADGLKRNVRRQIAEGMQRINQETMAKLVRVVQALFPHLQVCGFEYLRRVKVHRSLTNTLILRRQTT
jgi:hypothetical protein